MYTVNVNIYWYICWRLKVYGVWDVCVQVYVCRHRKMVWLPIFGYVVIGYIYLNLWFGCQVILYVRTNLLSDLISGRLYFPHNKFLQYYVCVFELVRTLSLYSILHWIGYIFLFKIASYLYFFFLIWKEFTCIR